jgi:sporulation protein YlmC with PRC-barrel domain
MLKFTGLFAAAAIALAPAAFARTATRPTPMWHTNQLVGTPVYNAQHQKIGTVADVLVSPNGAETEAVLNIGSFVGGHKEIAVPLSHLTQSSAHSMAMAHATKADLMAIPDYQDVGGNG